MSTRRNTVAAAFVGPGASDHPRASGEHTQPGAARCQKIGGGAKKGFQVRLSPAKYSFPRGEPPRPVRSSSAFTAKPSIRSRLEGPAAGL